MYTTQNQSFANPSFQGQVFQQVAQCQQLINDLIQQTHQSSATYQQMIQQEQQNAQRLEELAQRERQAVQMIQSVLQGHQTAIQRLQQAAQICSQLEQTWRVQASQVNYQQPAYQPSYSQQIPYSAAPYRQ